MSRLDLSNRIIALAIGVLVILAPVVILSITLWFLVLSEDLVLGRITLLEFFELYLIDLGLFTAFAYGLYRLMVTLVERQLPASLDALESNTTEDEEVRNVSDERE